MKCPVCCEKLIFIGVCGVGTVYRCRECRKEWIIAEYTDWKIVRTPQK